MNVEDKRQKLAERILFLNGETIKKEAKIEVVGNQSDTLEFKHNMKGGLKWEKETK